MSKFLSLSILLGVFLLYSCQQKQKPAEQTTQVKDTQALAQQKGCFACHDMDSKKVDLVD